MKNGFFAAINVGASAFRMQISEFKNGDERVLETLVKPLSLGKDTFSKKYITLENVYKAADILRGFKNKMDEYQITKYYKAICTSGVREATNRHFFIDHILRKTGLRLEIIAPSEEIHIKYLSARNHLKDFETYENKGVLFANVSSGNVSLSIVKDKLSVYSGSLPYGSLRLREIFKHIPYVTRHKAYSIYIQKMFHSIKGSLPSDLKLKYVISSGSSINLLSSIIDPSKGYFKFDDLKNLFERVKSLSTFKIIETFSIRKDEAKVLVPTLETYMTMMSFVKSDRVYFSRNSFPQMLIRFYSGKLSTSGFVDTVRNTLYYIGERYNFDRKHAENVKFFSLKLFDSLKSIHSMGRRMRYNLEAASILHDIGYFLGGSKHHEHSFYIVSSLSLPGLDQEDKDRIAYLTLMHRAKVSGDALSEFEKLPTEYQLDIKKLAGILRIADALDTSHTQHITDFNLEIKNDRIIIHAKCRSIPYMERMAFEEKRGLFTEVFGVPIELETKIDYE